MQNGRHPSQEIGYLRNPWVNFDNLGVFYRVFEDAELIGNILKATQGQGHVIRSRLRSFWTPKLLRFAIGIMHRDKES